MSGENVLREAVADHRRELLAMRPRWEALRRAARALSDSDGKIFGGRTFGQSWVRIRRGPYDALLAALAALERPAPEVRCVHGLRILPEPSECMACRYGEPEPCSDKSCPCQREPAPSSAPDREALVAEVVRRASLQGRGVRDWLPEAKSALLSAWEAEVAALRAERDALLAHHKSEDARLSAERDAALNRALAAEREVERLRSWLSEQKQETSAIFAKLEAAERARDEVVAEVGEVAAKLTAAELDVVDYHEIRRERDEAVGALRDLYAEVTQKDEGGFCSVCCASHATHLSPVCVRARRVLASTGEGR